MDPEGLPLPMAFVLSLVGIGLVLGWFAAWVAALGDLGWFAGAAAGVVLVARLEGLLGRCAKWLFKRLARR
jgi:hypothetical protein